MGLKSAYWGLTPKHRTSLCRTKTVEAATDTQGNREIWRRAGLDLFPTAGVFMIELIFERETVVRTSADESSDWRLFKIATSRCDEEHSALTLQQLGEKKE